MSIHRKFQNCSDLVVPRELKNCSDLVVPKS